MKLKIIKVKCCFNCKNRKLFTDQGDYICSIQKYLDGSYRLIKFDQYCDNWEVAH